MTTNILTLVEEVHVGTWQDGRSIRRPESHFLDFEIDGTALRTRAAALTDLVTNLNRAWRPDSVQQSVDVLLGRRADADLSTGRIPVLVCGQCGGLDCGALTARLAVTDRSVRWSDWRWADYEGEQDVDWQLDSFVFDRRAYEAAFDHAVDRVAQMPYDKLAHEGKRTLWPWQWGWKSP
jgi:hypothetical protein